MDKEKMKKEIGKMIDQMQEGSNDLKETLADTFEEAKGKAKENVDRARREGVRYVENNPEKSVLISAGVGALIGMGVALMLGSKGKCRNCR